MRVWAVDPRHSTHRSAPAAADHIDHSHGHHHHSNHNDADTHGSIRGDRSGGSPVELVASLDGREGCFHPLDGSLLLVAGSKYAIWADDTLRLWDVSSLHVAATIKKERHIDAVTSLAFSKDDKRVASGSMDRTVRVWHTPSGSSLVDGPCAGTHTNMLYYLINYPLLYSHIVPVCPPGKLPSQSPNISSLCTTHGWFRRFDIAGILNGHPGLWTKIYWGDDGKTVHTECGCVWEARGGKLLSLPATASDDADDSSNSGYPRETRRPLTVVSPDGSRAVCLRDGDDDDGNDDGGGDHCSDDDEQPQSLAADAEYRRLRSRLFLKYQVGG